MVEMEEVGHKAFKSHCSMASSQYIELRFNFHSTFSTLADSSADDTQIAYLNEYTARAALFHAAVKREEKKLIFEIT